MARFLVCLLPIVGWGCAGTGQIAVGDDRQVDDTDASSDDPSGSVPTTDPDEAVATSCDDPFEACGGDPTGDWDIVAVCLEPLDPGALGCDEATYEVVANRSSGRIVFEADQSYRRRYEIDLDFAMSVPLSCMFGQGCGGLVALSQGAIDSCDEVDGVCDCAGTVATLDEGEGTWSKDGDVLVTDGSDRTEICIRGDAGDSLGADGVRAIWRK